MTTVAQLKPFGPIPRDEFMKLVEAPFGEAIKRIRKWDPLYGRAKGEKIKWKVECRGELYGTAYVEAATQEEADKLADDLDCGAVDWGDGSSDFEIDSVEPVS